MLRGNTESYGLVTILFHWSIAALFLAQLPLGYLAHASSDRPVLQFQLYQWHKSIGFLVLALSIARIAWGFLDRRPGPAEDLAPWEKWLARSTHMLLYGATLAVPLTGWAIASTSPLGIPSYVFNLVVVPPLPMAVSQAAEDHWSTVHMILAYGTGVLAGLHMLAALHHHFVRGDGTLSSMLRPAMAERRNQAISRYATRPQRRDQTTTE